MSCQVQDLKTTQKSYEIKAENIKKNIAFLAADELKGREIGTEGIEKAARYIEKQFEEAQLSPYFKTYRDSFFVENKTAYNLIAFKEGKDPELKNEFVILGAHYDHLGTSVLNKENPVYNGANDNASGTSAVLELAKYFVAKETKRSMLFILFSAEEKGLKGSTHLAEKLKKEEIDLYTMLNFEMIGVPQNHSEYKAYLTGFHISNFSEVFNKSTQKNTLGFFEGEEKQQLFARSDNYPFYLKFFIPAHTLSTFTFDNYQHYHKVSDEIDLLDFDFMEELIQESIPGIHNLVDSERKEIQLRQNN